MSWLSETYEEWKPKSVNEFIGRRGASFFFGGLIVSLYFYIVEQYVSYLALGVMVLGLIMVGYAGDPDEDKPDEEA